MHRLSLSVLVLLALTFLVANPPLLGLSPLPVVLGRQSVVSTTSGQLPDFGLRFSEEKLKLGVGESSTIAINVYGINNFSGTVHLSASPHDSQNLSASPADWQTIGALSATVNPENVTVPGSSTLNVTSLYIGYFSVGVNASSGSLYHLYGFGVDTTATVSPRSRSPSILSLPLVLYGMLAAPILIIALGAIIVYLRKRTRSNPSSPATP